MVNSKSYVRNRQIVTQQKLIATLFFVFGLVFIFSTGQSVFAQGSNLEKEVYKKKKKTTTTKAKTKVKPKTTPVKKSTSKKSTPKKSTAKKTKAKRKSSRRRSNKRRNKNSILVKFNTPEPKQEIWRGEKKLGVTDETATLEAYLPKGNFFVSLKNQDGNVVLSKKMITVDVKNKEFALEYEKPKVEEPKETAEQLLLKEQEANAADAAEKITDILKRYGNPLTTNTVSLNDWKFVYQNAQANASKNFTAIQIEAQRWFSSGQIELAKGNYANAYAAFKESVKYMPDSAYPYYGLGEAYKANKQIPDALKAYQMAVQIDPKFALAHRKIGSIQLMSNRTKESVTSLQIAINNGFDTPSVRFDLAKSHLNNKNWDDASKELETVVTEAPTGDVYLTLGTLYTQLKRNISAYEAYRKATELSPTSAVSFFKLGEVLYDEKEYKKAKVAFEQALELDEKGKQININQAKKLVRECSQKLK